MPDIYDPRTRDEIFLNALKTGDISELPEPATREELFLSAIATRLSELSEAKTTVAEEKDEKKEN